MPAFNGHLRTLAAVLAAGAVGAAAAAQDKNDKDDADKRVLSPKISTDRLTTPPKVILPKRDTDKDSPTIVSPPVTLPSAADRIRDTDLRDLIARMPKVHAEQYAPGRGGPTASVAYHLPGKDREVTLEYEIIDGYAVYEGDIILGRHDDLADVAGERASCTGDTCTVRSPLIRRAGESYLWPAGVIPYEIASGFTAAERQEIVDAIAMVGDDTDLILKPRDGETDYVRYRKVDEGCSSDVGRQSDRQDIKVSAGCSTGNIAHETLHAAGIWHEQSRSDRSDFIRINLDNVEDGKKHNFDMHDSDGVDIGAYDYGSIMHYPSWAFGKEDPDTGEKMTTIEVLTDGATIGQRSGLSARDIAGINDLYGAEDCTFFNPNSATAARRNGRWALVDGDHLIQDFGGNESEARRALQIVKNYGMDQFCFVGRPDPSYMYFLADGDAPSGAMSGEDCIGFNRARLTVEKRNGTWTLVNDGSNSIMTFPNPGEGFRTLDIIQQRRFSRTCYVGRPDPSFKYMRR